MRIILTTFFLFTALLAVDFESNTRFSNTNFGQYAKSDTNSFKFDYNRFRVENKTYLGAFSTQIIIDNDSILGPSYLKSVLGTQADPTNYTPDIPFTTSIKLGDNAYDRVKLYRAQVKYAGEQHTLTLGLQRVAFGVGRIWTPTDMFNPLKTLSLESAERPPVLAADYNFAINDTSSLETVVSIQENNNTKAAFRLKGYVLFADMALLAVKEKDRQLLGYELEGHLFDTGVEFRSEGGVFTNTEKNKSFTKFIIGADYAFENSLMFTLEYLYNQTDYSEKTLFGYTIGSYGDDTFTDVLRQKDNHYVAAMAMYAFTPLLNGALISMVNAQDRSGIVVPTLSYSLSDESSMSAGGFISWGEKGSEYASTVTLLFASLSVTF